MDETTRAPGTCAEPERKSVSAIGQDVSAFREQGGNSGTAMEFAAEEAECVRMALDDMGVPKRGEDGDLSLVGRLMVAIVTYGQGFDPVSELRIAIAAHGSQKAFAERAGVSAQYVNDVLQRRREPGFAITQALGLERIVAYRRMR